MITIEVKCDTPEERQAIRELFNEMGIVHTDLQERDFALLNTAGAKEVMHSIRQAKSYIPPFKHLDRHETKPTPA